MSTPSSPRFARGDGTNMQHVDLIGHTGGVRLIRILPNGGVVAGSSDGSCRTWDLATGRELAVMRGHEQGVTQMVLAKEGKRLVTSSYDGTARVWNPMTGEQLVTYTGHGGWIRDLAVSGHRVATASSDHTCHIFDLETGRLERRFEGHSDWLRCCTWTHDGSQVVTSARDKTVRIWDPRVPSDRSACISTLQGHTDTVRCLAVSAASGLLVTGSVDGTARVWDLRKPDLAACVLAGHGGAITNVAIAPWREMAVTSAADGRINLWGLPTGELARSFDGHAASWVCDFTLMDDRQVASAGGDGTMLLWSSSSGTINMTLRASGGAQPVLCLAAESNDETTTVVWGQDAGAAGADIMPSRDIVDEYASDIGVNEEGDSLGTSLSSSPSSLSSPAFSAAVVGPEGTWFMKRGGWRKTGGLALTGRKRRFCVLVGGELRYFAAVRNGVPTSQKGAIRLQLPGTDVEVIGRRLLLHNPDRTWDLEAETEAIALEWMGLVQVALAGLAEQGEQAVAAVTALS